MARNLFPTMYNKKEKKREETQKKLITQRQEERKTKTLPIEYNKKGYTGSSATRKTSYDWEKNILHDLPKQYGRNYNDKFNNWATKTLGFSREEANEFRTWLDSKEDVIKTRKRSNQEGYKEIPIRSQSAGIEDMLKDRYKNPSGNIFSENATFKQTRYDKEQKEAKKKKEKQELKDQRNDRDGVLGLLDRTIGRASRSAQELVLGKDFVDRQDDNYRRFADEDSLKQTNTVSRDAIGGLEKGADIAGTVLGIGSYVLPGSASYKAVNTAGNLAKLTKGGSQVAASLASKPYTTELLRGAAAGGVFGVGNQSAREVINPDEFNGADHWKRIGLDIALGGAGDVAFRAIGKGFTALKNNRADAKNLQTGAYADVEVPSYTGQPSKSAIDSLAQGQSSLINSQSRSMTKNVGVNKLDDVIAEMRAARQTGAASPIQPEQLAKRVDSAMAQQREQAIEAQFQYLKSYQGKGVQKGGLGRNEMGEVVTAIPPISNNAGWYRELGGKPSQKQLRELAVKHVDEGFVDELGNIPPWRPQQLDELEQQIAQYTRMISESPEQTPAIMPLLQAAEEDYTAILTSYNKVKPQQAPTLMDSPIQQDVPIQQQMQPETPIQQSAPIQPPRETSVPQAFDNVMNDISGLRGSIDNQRQNIENITPPPQTASNGVNKGDNVPEGILSQSEKSPQITAKETEFDSGKDIVLPDGRKVDMSDVRFNERMVRQSEKELETATKNNDVDGIRVAKSKLERYTASLEKAKNTPKFQTADEFKKNNKLMQIKKAQNTLPMRQPNPNAKPKPITERELTDNLRSYFGIPIRKGHTGQGQGVAGIYKVNSEVVRTKKTNDIPVISHEIGHHLDKQFNLTRNLGDDYKDELLELGVRTSGDDYATSDVIEEGLAEFVRLRLTDVDLAKQIAPKFSKLFNQRLDKKTLKAIESAKVDIDRWIDQGAAMQLRGKIDTIGKPESEVKLGTDMYRQLIDNKHMLKKMEIDLDGKEMKRFFRTTKFLKNDADDSIYKQAALSAGAPRIAQMKVKEFDEILKKAQKNANLSDVRDYVTAKHARELEYMGIKVGKEAVEEAKLISKNWDKTVKNPDKAANKIIKGFSKKYEVVISDAQKKDFILGNGLKLTPQQLKKIVNANHIESGMTPKQIREAIRLHEKNPAIIKAQKEIVDYQNTLIDMLQEEGFLTAKAVKSMREKYPDYVPFQRFFEEDLAGGLSGSSKGFVDLSNPIKRLKGSDRNIIDPFESIVRNTFNVINQVEKNKVGKHLERLSQIDKSGAWVEKLPGNTRVEKENIVTVWNNGEKAQYQVHKDVYSALKGLDDTSSHMIMQLAAKPASWLRAGATLTPEFMIRNPIRDQVSAYVNSKSGYNPFVDLPLGMISVVQGKMGMKTSQAQHYYDWVKEGGSFGGYLSGDRDFLKETVQHIKKEGFKEKGVRTISNPKEFAKSLSRAIDKLVLPLQVGSEIMEEATKVGEFRKALRKGVSEKEAAYRSRDLMDFARGGSFTKEANKLISFLNANVQGKDKLARSFMENPVRTTTKALAAVTMPTIGAYMAMEHMSNAKQKEAWENVPQWQKDTFWILPIPGTDELARIPKPFDLAPLFSNPAESAMEYMKENDPEAWEGFVKRNATALVSLPLSISAIAPTIENITNYDFFTHNPVVPTRDQDLLPEDQFNQNTSFVAKKMGNLTKTSPYKWDNFIQGHFAGLGQYALDGVDFVAEKSGADTIPQPETKWSEKPVIKAFTVNTTGSGQIMTDFYDKMDKLKKDNLRAAKQGKSVDDNKLKKLEEISKDISEIRKEYRSVQMDKDMSRKEKRRKMDNLNADMNRLAKRGVKEAK